MKGAWAAAAAAVLTAACAGQAKPAASRTVVVEGWAPLGAGASRSDARRRALTDAARRAVEQGGGVEVAALSTVDDAARLRERVSAAAVGRVRGLKVLEEREADGGLSVRVRAEVEPREGAVKDGWIQGVGPSAVVGGADPDLREPFASVWTSCGGGLAADGEEPDLSFRLIASARRFEEPRVSPFVSVRVRVSASARSAGGEAWSGTRESAALGADEPQARALALREAGEALARDAARALSGRLWPTSGRSGR